ncbi:MAG: sigma-54 dependent transcriptional regulator [Planctomycetes bacterium]|nr:sigma-54 dependent transcriptional regulator [Planctomycetota bacterium]
MFPVPTLIGSSRAIAGVRRAISQVASTDATVLIHGETGTGKELVASSIHAHSRRAARPFIAANCGAFVSGLAASELFGHEAGAFTGAIKRRIGRFEAAHAGTLFLDEIGELPTGLQPLLLRVLQEQIIERVGGDAVSVDVRVIAATNCDLATEVKTSRFRADLFYRLNVFPITIPPLRERREDIAVLAEQFVRQLATTHDRLVSRISPKTMELLVAHDWPGNVRELRNVIERAVIVSVSQELEVDPTWFTPSAPTTGRTWATQEKTRILEALRAVGGRIYGPGGAAHRLGLRPTTLYGKMRKHGISKEPSSWQ